MRLDKKTQKPNYVTDSAALCDCPGFGVKTYNGALGIDVTANRTPPFLEAGKENGKATGECHHI